MTATPRLLDVFAGLTAADPDAVVLYDAHAGQAPARPVTRRQLRDLAAGMAEDLRAHGVGTGDCVAVWLPNWSHTVAVQFAALAVGAHVIGINTRYNVDEVAHVLRMARPRAVVAAHGFLNLDLRAILHAAHEAAATAAPVCLVTTAPGTPGAAPEEVASYDVGGGASAFPRASGGGELRPCPEPGLATAFTTSGSTGHPKLAAHRELGLGEHLLAAAGRIGLGPGHVVLGALPLSGVFGFVAAMAAVVSGAAVVLEPVFDAGGVLTDVVRHRVTHVIGADDLIGRLERAWRDHPVPLPWQWIGIADFEGRSRQLAEWAEREFGTTVAGVYGSSELFALTAFWPRHYAPELRWTGGGQVVTDSIEVRVADPATEEVVPDGAEGEMQFRGPNVVDAYLGDPAVAGEVFTRDGWFRSGDLGRLVAPGTVQYLCRIGDVLRLRGFLVDPSEIEARLAAHPGVAMTKVVGVPGRGGGTIAVAFVVPYGPTPPAEDELRQWCAQTLAKFKVPSRIRLIDEMPTTSGTNGTKIRAAALRELALAEGI
ncbi:AMP-binding protein [Amycolatopsis thermophila]|uniref:Long-chain-fatty-acid--CoA ligase n=1 Tax=Amycolatopsis thermophila TaxID=206084 RepID=A0ABU0EYV0_9PSEU|nr:AMP-binding protein [Amycolatopsis thermophila]MDQ0380493.1 fatty-acyl-CoA synthase [Amycolatopsis thermophila]